MEPLSALVSQVMNGYAGRALNGWSYLLCSTDRQVLAIVSVGHLRDREIVQTGLLVRVVGERIVIERDINDKPLVEALVEAGVARERIVLKYAGESEDRAA